MIQELTPSFLNHLRYLPTFWVSTPKSSKMKKLVACRYNVISNDFIDLDDIDFIIHLN